MIRSGLFTFILFIALKTCAGVNVLMMPPPGEWKHQFLLAEVGRTLKAKGHQVTFLLSLASPPSAASNADKFKFEYHQDAKVKASFDSFSNEFASEALSANRDSGFGQAQQFNGLQAEACDSLLEDQALIQRLRSNDYKMIVGDTTSYCHVLTSELLGVPFVSFTPGRMIPTRHARPYMVPSFPSYVPEAGTGFTDYMDFWQRAQNLWAYAMGAAFNDLVLLAPYDRLKQKHAIWANISMFESIGKAQLWLFNSDFSFEFPRPLMPNVVMTGGMTSQPASPLNKDLEQFMSSGGASGVVVVSFGSYLSQQNAELFATALSKLPQKVLWRYGGKTPTTLGKNTKIVQWIPQNDVLGHGQVKAFVTDGGTNSLFEAIYHGVPVVGIPQKGSDTGDNMVRVAAKGVGLTLHRHNLSSQGLHQAITTVITDPRYKANMTRLSGFHKHCDPLKPRERAGFWIEHVIKFGGRHLRAAAFELTWYQYYLLDVFVFLAAVFYVIYFVLRRTFSYLCGVCCRSSKKKEKTQ